MARGIWFIFFLCAIRLCALDNIFFGDRLIRLGMDDFKPDRVTNEEDRFYLTAFSGDTVLSVALTMEAYADSRTCREFRWATALKAKIKRENIRQYDYKDFAVVEWDAPAADGGMKNINAYYAKDGIAMAVHLVRSNCADGKKMLPLLDPISVTEIPLTYQLCFKGKAAFNRQDYAGALAFLRPALVAENKKNELKPKEWRNLVVWTGMAEGMNGNLQAAEEIFIQALKRDAKYALFHYNLACVYAERNNLPRALGWLEKAFLNRGTLNPGEQFPDPLADASFQPFKSDERLLALVKKYQPADKPEKTQK